MYKQSFERVKFLTVKNVTFYVYKLSENHVIYNLQGAAALLQPIYGRPTGGPQLTMCGPNLQSSLAISELLIIFYIEAYYSSGIHAKTA
jgi:hypothetical protein